MVGLGAPLRGREEREKAQGTLWEGPPKMCCGAWKIPPRGIGVIKAWAVPLEKGREGRPGQYSRLRGGARPITYFSIYRSNGREGQGCGRDGRCLVFLAPGSGEGGPLSLYLEDPGQPLALALNLGKRRPCWKE